VHRRFVLLFRFLGFGRADAVHNAALRHGVHAIYRILQIPAHTPTPDFCRKAPRAARPSIRQDRCGVQQPQAPQCTDQQSTQGSLRYDPLFHPCHAPWLGKAQLSPHHDGVCLYSIIDHTVILDSFLPHGHPAYFRIHLSVIRTISCCLLRVRGGPVVYVPCLLHLAEWIMR
jgi:hypothetical protein